MNIFRILIAIIYVAIATPLFAQATPETIADSVIADLKNGDATTTVENLIAKAPLVAVGPAEKTNLINTLNTFLTSYGKVGGWELIQSRSASSRYLEHSYIVFQEKYALHMELKFYQGADGWNLTAFNFSDTLDKSLDAQAMDRLEQSIRALASKN